MNTEWHHLARHPASAEALRRWHQLEPSLTPWSTLDDLRAAAHDRTQPQHAQQILTALIRLATNGRDRLAARTILQLLLPGAARLTANLTRLTGDRAETEAAVLVELAIGIATYPWQRRTGNIAANLLLDTRQKITRHHRRTRRETPTTIACDTPHSAIVGIGAATTSRDCEAAEARLEVCHLLRWAHRHRVLTTFEINLLIASRIHQTPMTQLAHRYGRSRSALYATRAVAEQRLRNALGPNRPSTRQ